MRHLYSLLLVLFVTAAGAQTLSPNVIASAGGSFSSAEFSMDYTLAETFVTTLSNGTNTLTQGFHQPQAGVIVQGCTNPQACNYNPDATEDDGSCQLPGELCDDGNPETENDVYQENCTCAGIVVVTGCTAPEACNFIADANVDDGSCIFPGFPCDDLNEQTDFDAINADCICVGSLIGCTNAQACNYNAAAAADDGSCEFPGTPCDDNNPETLNDVISPDCVCSGEIPVAGCTTLAACNYNPDATEDDGSCQLPGELCDDGNPETENDVYQENCTCAGIVLVTGCTAPEACNFIADANVDDGSCIFPGFPCDDLNEQTDFDAINADCICVGSLIGCTNAQACNYNAAAAADDGSCEFPGTPCDDNNPETLNDVISPDCVCSGEIPVAGCTTLSACNYNPDATVSDDSCEFPGSPCNDNNPTTENDVILEDCSCAGTFTEIGCTAPDACNYNPAANIDDGSCILVGSPCDDNNPNTILDAISIGCDCKGFILGCTSAVACNFNPEAEFDDVTCFFPGDACDDFNVFTVDDAYSPDCVCQGQLLEFAGCTDPFACNFDPTAILDDGSCFSTGDLCNDGNIFTINDAYTEECICQGIDVGPILGCTVPVACNFNPDANVNDGSCQLPGSSCDDEIEATVQDVWSADCVCEGLLTGCTQEEANNFNPLAIVDDGSCEFDVLGCTDPEAVNYNNQANVDDGSCLYGVFGCTAPDACNYNSDATLDDASCIFPNTPCDDGNDATIQDEYGVDCACSGILTGCTIPVATNYNPDAVIDDGSCEFDTDGCTDPDALNYDPAALTDDGSCIYPVLGCTDETACNYNPQANVSDDSCILPGCLDDFACNYDPNAPCEGGFCDYPDASYLDCDGNCLNDINSNEICDELEPQGCTDTEALNYNAEAIIDDGSCEYTTPGCITPGACNFNPQANVDDGSCTFPGCNDPDACNYDSTAGCYDGNCDYPVTYYDCNGICLNDSNSNGICDEYDTFGCTDETALNYNMEATSDNGSCIYGGCLDATACNYDATADQEDGSCTYPGCNDPAACNYNELAGCLLAGSCDFAEFAYDCDGNCLNDANGNGICDEFDTFGCTDVNADNYSPIATIDDGTCIFIGCTDPTACNFDPTALDEDGSCTYPGCTNPTACNFDGQAGCDDGSCIPSGCTNTEACNFDPLAQCDDSSCTFEGCNDPAACNFDPLAGCLLEGSCDYPEEYYDCDGNCLNDGNNNGICDFFDQFGCLDPLADNFNQFAIIEDNSCIYVGCMDVNACNFDPTALEEDGSCTYPTASCLNCFGECILDADADDVCDCFEIEGCTNPESANYDPTATEFDGSCVLGCTDPFSVNYDPQANEDDGTCLYQVLGCTYPTACNYNPDATTDNNTCVFPGCNDLSACNYDPDAGCLLEGSCEYIDENENGQCDQFEIFGCTNGDACNFNPLATFDDGSCGFDSNTIIDVTTDVPYVWYGVEYTQTGQYDTTFVTPQGCDSTITLNLTVTGVFELDVNSLSIWPNPANREVQVLVNQAIAAEIQVFDIVGKHVITVQRQSRIDVSAWSSGIYVLRIYTDRSVMERRLEIVR